MNKRAGMSELVITIDNSRFNDTQYLEYRVAQVPNSDSGALRTALKYLYLDDGPVNLPRERLRIAENYLDPAEMIVVRWLYTRTNGSLRKEYGADSLIAARLNRYQCESCGFSDVRALNLDHVDGRTDTTPFACLCANCHTIKSRAQDWTGQRK